MSKDDLAGRPTEPGSPPPARKPAPAEPVDPATETEPGTLPLIGGPPADAPAPRAGRRALKRNDAELSDENRAERAALRAERLQELQTSAPRNKGKLTVSQHRRPEHYTRSGQPSSARVLAQVRERMKNNW